MTDRAEAAEAQCAVLRQALEKVLGGRCWCAPHPETRVLGHDASKCEGFLALASADAGKGVLENLRERCAMVLLAPEARQNFVMMGALTLPHCADKIRALPLLVEETP